MKTFSEFIEQSNISLLEMTQSEHDSLLRKIAQASTPEEKERLRKKLKEKIQKQRESILNDKKPIDTGKFSSSSNSTPSKNKAVQSVNRFIKYTTLGGLAF